MTEKEKRMLKLACESTQQSQRAQTRERNSPQCNTHPPNGLALVAVRLSGPRPAHVVALLADIVAHRFSKSKGIRGVSGAVRVVDEAAVEVGKGLAENDGDDDKSDEPEEVEHGHDQEADVGVGPEEGDGDEAVECGETCLKQGKPSSGLLHC